MFICYILLPEIPFGVGDGNLKKNHLLILTMVFLFFNYILKKKYSIDVNPYKFCIVYFILSALFVPLKFDTKYSIQIYYLIYDIAIILLFPIAIWNIINKEKCISLFRNALLVCIGIACLYGLILTLTNGFNPLVVYFSSFGGGLDEEAWTQYFSDEGRLFGRISSVFYHPMHYASFLGFSALYVSFIREKLTKGVFLFLFGVILINFFTCGVRSVLGAIIASLFVYIVTKRDAHLVFKVILAFMIGFIIISAIPPVYDYVNSIFDSSNNDVKGSSVEMRLDQLSGAFEEIQDNIFLGKGYGWSRDYIIQYKNHPVLLGFESIVFVTICNNGILGILLYCLFAFAFYKYVKFNVKEEDRPFFISLLTFYFAYEGITGEFAFQHFMLFYTFALFESMESDILLDNDETGICEEEILLEKDNE